MGMQGDSNYYALLVDLWIPLAFVWSFSRRPAWERLFSFACLASSLLGVTFAASRGGFLGLTAALLYLIWRSRSRVRNFIFASILVIPLLLGSSSSPLRRLTKPAPSDLFAEEARIIAWKSGWRMIKAHPFAGVGLHNFNHVILNYEDPSWSTEVTNYEQITTIAHNTYIELAAETGVLGVVAFLGVVITAFRVLDRVRRRTRTRNLHFSNVALGLQAGLISFAISAVFLSAWWEKIVWLVIFLSVCVHRLCPTAAQPRGQKQGRAISQREQECAALEPCDA
jgi:O-antigen ligase